MYYPDGGIDSRCATGDQLQLPGASGTNTVTCPVTGLQPSTTYNFQLNARWAGGDWQTGAKLSFTTLASSLGGYTINTIFTNILTASHPVTDWAISNLRITPSSPKVGDLLTFALDLTALSTNAPYPQSVDTSCWVDNLPPLPPVGASPYGGATTYYGPTGTPMTLTVNYPWTATAGTHTTTCSVGQTNDPDASNNKVSLTFTIGSAVGAPAVQTIQATDITDTSATLYGNLNPNGQNTSLVVMRSIGRVIGATYCPNQPGGQLLGSGTDLLSVSSKLEASTTYTFQLYAFGDYPFRYGSLGVPPGRGGSLSFTTKPSASATSTVSTTGRQRPHKFQATRR